MKAYITGEELVKAKRNWNGDEFRKIEVEVEPVEEETSGTINYTDAPSCYTQNGMMVCHCGKCRRCGYDLPKDIDPDYEPFKLAMEKEAPQKKDKPQKIEELPLPDNPTEAKKWYGDETWSPISSLAVKINQLIKEHNKRIEE